jgi:hypothetical protein
VHVDGKHDPVELARRASKPSSRRSWHCAGVRRPALARKRGDTLPGVVSALRVGVAVFLGMSLVCAASRADPAEPTRTAVIRFDSDTPDSWLEREVTGSDGWYQWRRICRAPCWFPAEAPRTYRVAGPTITSSEEIEIGPGPWRVRASAGSPTLRGLGIVLIPVGSVLSAFGLLSATNLGEGESSHPRETAVAVLAFGGILTFATGIFLVVANRTSVDVTRDRGAAAPRAPSPGFMF